MNILLLGGGGREHAMAWKIAQSPACKKLFIAPGNGGTRLCGTNLPISPVDFPSISRLVREEKISMVVVGPEDPLVKGIHDYFLADPGLKNVPVIGPLQQGARLEGSKDFSKAFMARNRIPTAAYQSFTREGFPQACRFLESLKPPYVLKADGLAAGKGVLIINDYKEACHELDAMLGGRFGAAGEKVVIEQFLKGIELSVFVVTDGRDYCLLPEAKDYKRIGEGDSGPNTGGMGSVSGVPFADPAFMLKVKKQIIEPTIAGLAAEKISYRGFIFFGLIRVGSEPYVIEYNARLGDPETESVLPRLKTDLLEIFQGMAEGTLSKISIQTDPRFVGSVMMVSGGYPGAYEKGAGITGLDSVSDSLIFHAGTRFDPATAKYFTDGGRVLAVSSFGNSPEEALKKSYLSASSIHFKSAFFRKDIGFDL